MVRPRAAHCLNLWKNALYTSHAKSGTAKVQIMAASSPKPELQLFMRPPQLIEGSELARRHDHTSKPTVDKEAARSQRAATGSSLRLISSAA